MAKRKRKPEPAAGLSLLTLAQVAERLGITSQAAGLRVNAGKIRAIKVEGRWMVADRDLDRYIRDLGF